MISTSINADLATLQIHQNTLPAAAFYKVGQKVAGAHEASMNSIWVFIKELTSRVNVPIASIVQTRET